MKGLKRHILTWAVLSLAISAQGLIPNRVSDGSETGIDFEVAVIKPIDPKAPHSVGIEVYPGGKVIIKGFSVKGLICAAFNVSAWQITGGESWTSDTIYDVEAVAPSNTQPDPYDTRHTLFTLQDERLRKMLQRLLIDRFSLKFHLEEKTGKIYVLTRTSKKLQLKPTKVKSTIPLSPADPGGSVGWADRWVIADTSMTQLAKFAADFYVHAPVLDQTGLTGAFDYEAPPEDSTTFWSNQTASFLNLIRDVGLKLQPSQGPVPVFVIEHIERPSPN